MQLNFCIQTLVPHLEIGTLGVDSLAVKDPIQVGFLTCSSTSVTGSRLWDREIGRWLGQLFGTILTHIVSVTGTGLCTGNNTNYNTQREREREYFIKKKYVHIIISDVLFSVIKVSDLRIYWP